MKRHDHHNTDCLEAIFLFCVLVIFSACIQSPTSNSIPVNHPPTITPTQIIARAKNTPFQSASFNITVTSNNLLVASGSGKLTSNPEMTCWKLNSAADDSFYELIAAGQVIYEKNNDTNWYQIKKSDYHWSEMIDYDDLQDIVFVGIEAINGTPAFHIHGQLKDNRNAASVITRDLWVRQDNYYPIKIISDYKDSSLYNQDTIYQFLFVAWNQPVQIDLPATSG